MDVIKEEEEEEFERNWTRLDWIRLDERMYDNKLPRPMQSFPLEMYLLSLSF